MPGNGGRANAAALFPREAMHPKSRHDRYSLVRRRFSALILCGLGAAAIVAASTGEPTEAAPADPAAVDLYITELERTVPPPTPARLSKDPIEDEKLEKTAQKLDRAEPILGAVISVVR